VGNRYRHDIEQATSVSARPGLVLAAAFLACISLFGGCADEEGIFEEVVIGVERPLAQLPDQTFNFLGYFDAENTTPVCSACHAGPVATWRDTGHATAWEGLQASGHAQSFCEGCHAVSQLGNAIDNGTAAGYNLVADERYEDVQCESCHGPGFDHVQNPDAVKPLASIAADTGLGNGCGDCHEGSHHPFVEQWRASRHGSPSALGIAGTIDGCNECHEGRKALDVKFGESSNYVERDAAELQPITCAVCHDPHGTANDGNLRAPIDVATTENLCVTCHARRGTPPSPNGPHAAQGLLVLDQDVGWIPPGFVYDTLRFINSHGKGLNRKLCATCHVAVFEVTDQATDAFLFQSVGHSFEALPCLDAQGLPTAGPCDDADRSFRTCTTAGCHGAETAPRFFYRRLKTRLEELLDQLWFDTDGNTQIDATDAGLLPQVVARGDRLQLDLRDRLVTVAEGALWNAMLAHTSDRPWFGDGSVFGLPFSSHKSSGNGVHNPYKLEALLIASIQAVVDEYGLASPSVDLTSQLTPSPAID
jgi:predicted CXXCH cytochrome family protein